MKTLDSLRNLINVVEEKKKKQESVPEHRMHEGVRRHPTRTSVNKIKIQKPAQHRSLTRGQRFLYEQDEEINMTEPGMPSITNTQGTDAITSNPMDLQQTPDIDMGSDETTFEEPKNQEDATPEESDENALSSSLSKAKKDALKSISNIQSELKKGEDGGVVDKDAVGSEMAYVDNYLDLLMDELNELRNEMEDGVKGGETSDFYDATNKLKDILEMGYSEIEEEPEEEPMEDDEPTSQVGSEEEDKEDKEETI